MNGKFLCQAEYFPSVCPGKIFCQKKHHLVCFDLLEITKVGIVVFNGDDGQTVSMGFVLQEIWKLLFCKRSCRKIVGDLFGLDSKIHKDERGKGSKSCHDVVGREELNCRDAYADYWIGQKDGENSSGYNFSVYDDGYDDIYMDGDYDYDRYNKDPDYADGVDDAMDEYGEDW